MIAQTNLQLFAQLHAAGWTLDQMAPIREAYRLAIELFAARFRGNGRPFICHLVGSASIGVDLGFPRDQIAASLLHASYEQGAFPSGRQGAHPTNRELLRARVGASIESLVDAYQNEPWNDAVIDAMIAAAPLPPTRQAVAEMRLADLLDDLQDAGCVSTPGKFDAAARRRIAKAVALAESIGRPDLATQLRSAEAANAAAGWAVEAVKGQAQSFSIRRKPFAALRARFSARSAS